MAKMTLNEAIFDPKRPLSITPSEWMMSAQANLAEEQELTKKSTQRIIQAKKEKSNSTPKKDFMISGIQTIDIGIDQIIQGIKIVYSGFDDTDKADLFPAFRKAVSKIKDLMDTAIVPYMKDVVDYSNELEDDEKQE